MLDDRPLFRAHAALAPALTEVERRLDEIVRSPAELIPEVANHLLAAGGKRVRPVLLLLAAEAAGADSVRGVELAVAVEVLHSATLLHDDVVDRGELRRGVTAAPVIFGNAASVLVGDFLLAQALNLVSGHGDLDLVEAYTRVLAEMAEGEVLQLLRSGGLDASTEDYVRIIAGKTAGLFAWATRAGASLAGNRAPRDLFEDFGRSFGMAFQITDDVIDYVTPPEQSGKAVAADLEQGKATLPLLLAMRHDPALRLEVEALAAVDEPGDARIQQVIGRVRSSGAVEQARDEARRHADEARRAMASLPTTAARDLLVDLAGFVVARLA